MTPIRLYRSAVALMALLAVAFLAVLWAAGPAFAQETPGQVVDGDLSPDTPFGSYFTVSNTLVTLLLAGVLPLVIGVLLKPGNPPVVKGLVAMLVTTAGHALSQAVQADGTAVLSQEWLVQLAITFLATIGAYYGAWNPLADNELDTKLGPGLIGR